MPVMQWLISFLGVLNPSYAAESVSPVFKLTLVFGAVSGLRRRDDWPGKRNAGAVKLTLELPSSPRHLQALWAALIVAAAAWSAYSFSIGNFTTVLPLKFLKSTARLTTTALFVPLASLLISVYKCHAHEHWSVTDFECYGVEHSLLMAMVSVLLPCFWVFSLCVSAVFFDRNYRSSNITARTHGRVGIAMISIKSSLTLIFTVAQDADPWFLHIVVIGLGALWLWLYLRFLPNFTQWMNQIWTAFGAVFFWAGLCAALARVLANPGAGVAGYVFFIGVPTAAYTGYALAYMRFQAFGRVGMAGGPVMRTPYEVELRARYILRDVMMVGRAEEHTGHRAVHARRVSIAGMAAGNGHSSRASSASTGGHEHHQYQHQQQHDGYSSVHDRMGVSSSVVRSRETRMTAEEQAAAIAEVSALYDKAQHVFPNSAILCLFHAQFMRCFLNDREREMQIIQAGYDKEPSVDVKFLLYQSTRALEEEGGEPGDGSGGGHGDGRGGDGALGGAGSHGGHGGHKKGKHGHGKHGHGGHGSGKMSLIDRVQFEKLIGESGDASKAARTNELAFWGELRRPSPDLAKLHTLAEAMSNAISKATSAFEKLLSMQPDAVEVLQQYAVFLLEVKREVLAANKYFDQADELIAQREAAAAALQKKHDDEMRARAEKEEKERQRVEQQHVMMMMMQQQQQQQIDGGGGPGPGRQASQLSPTAAAGAALSGAAAAAAQEHHASPHLQLGTALMVGSAIRKFRSHGKNAGRGSADGMMQQPQPRLLASPSSSGYPALISPGAASIGGAASMPGSRLTSPMAHHHQLAGHLSLGAPASVRSPLASGAGGGSGLVYHLSSSPLISPMHGGFGTVSPSAASHGAFSSLGGLHPGILSVMSPSAASHGALSPSASGTSGGGMLSSTAMGGTPSHHHAGGGHAGADAGDIDAQLISKAKRRGSVALASYAAAISKVRRASLVMRQGAESQHAHAQRRSSWTLDTPLGPPPPSVKGGAGGKRGSLVHQNSDRSISVPPLPTKTAPAAGKQQQQPTSKHHQQRRHDSGGSAAAPAPAAAVTLHTVQPVGTDNAGAGTGVLIRKQPSDFNIRGFPADKMESDKATQKRLDAERVEAEAKDRRARKEAEEEQRREREKERRYAAFSEKAKEEAKRKRQDANEAAATSLRLAITTRAAVMEPSLINLVRAITVFFVTAAVVNIVSAAVQRWLLTGISDGVDLLQAAGVRSLMVEDVLRSASQLDLYATGRLPFDGAGVNASYLKLLASTAALDELHRRLYLSTADATSSPEEADLYNRNSLPVLDMSYDSLGRQVVAERLVSLSNLGIEFVSKASLVVSLPLVNVTSRQPSVWYLLHNGPTVVRQAMNASTILLSDRVDGHESLIRLVDLAVMIAACVVFGGLSIVIVLPIVLLVKRDTDSIFSIFLNLPDETLEQMETTCKAQIDALSKLEDANNPNADTALALALQRQAVAKGSGDVEEPAEEDVADVAIAIKQSRASGKSSKVGNPTAVATSSSSSAAAAAKAAVAVADKSSHQHIHDVDADAQLVEAGGDDVSDESEEDEEGDGEDGYGQLLKAGTSAHGKRAGTKGSGRRSREEAMSAPDRAAAKAARMVLDHDVRSHERLAGGAAPREGKDGGLESKGMTRQPSALHEIKSSMQQAALIRSVSHALLPGAKIVAEVDGEEDDQSMTRGPGGRGGGAASASFRVGLTGVGGSFNLLLGMGGGGGAGGSSVTSGSLDEFGVPRMSLGSGMRKRRKFQTSLWMGFKLLVRFTWPLFVLLGFYVGVWGYEGATLSSALDFKKDALYFGEVDSLIAHVNHAVRSVLLSGAPPSGGSSVTDSCNTTALDVSMGIVDATTATINTLQDAVLYGDSKQGIQPSLASDSTLQGIMLTNGCATPDMPSDCSSRTGFYHGLLSDGLQAALREYNLLARHAIQLRQADLLRAGGVCPGLVSPLDSTLTSLDQMAHVYMRAAFSYVVQRVVDLSQSSVAGFLTGHAVLTTLSVLLLLFLYYVFFIGSIRTMDRDIKRTRGTLLLFPTDVLAGVAAFVQMSGEGIMGGGGNLGLGGSKRQIGDGEEPAAEDESYKMPARLKPNLIGRMR